MAKNDTFNKINKNTGIAADASRQRYEHILGGIGSDVANAREADNVLRGNITDRLLTGGPQRNKQGWFDLPIGNDLYGQRLRSGLLTQAHGGPGFGHDQSAIDMWQNWRDTGGMDDRTVEGMRRAGSHVVPGIYNNLKNQMERRRVIQGGYSPGYDANTAALARDASREASRATDESEGTIAGMRHQGKMFGASGFDSYLKGMRNADIQQRQFGLSGLSDLEGRNLSAQLQMGNDELARTNSLLGLYGAAPGATNAAYTNAFRGMGGLDDSSLNYMQLLAGMNPKRSVWDTIFKGAGAAGGLLTGFGAMR